MKSLKWIALGKSLYFTRVYRNQPQFLAGNDWVDQHGFLDYLLATGKRDEVKELFDYWKNNIPC